MSPIFKPTPISWGDIEGGLGEAIEERVCNFVWEYCYPDEEGNPRRWNSDEELPVDLAFFEEAWDKIDGNRDEIATPEQTAAVLSLVEGSFFDSMARDKIAEALIKSATKPQLVKIMTHVASAYCQYVALKARVEIAEARAEIDLRRRELAYLNFEGRDKVDPNDRDALLEEDSALDAEQAELAKEEADLRHTLEDAGAPAPTTEDHAREKLSAIRSRLAEIAAADQKTRVFEDLDGEEENLAAEERDLAAYLEAIDAAADDPPGAEQPAGNGEPAPHDPPEDEEVGSFTLGKCNYCGREWGVTLEGAKGGGYPTQKTANAAATRVCDCPEAVENRKPEMGSITDCIAAVNILVNMEEDVDDWMIAGINAMLDKVRVSRGIPFDLSTSICGLLGAQYR